MKSSQPYHASFSSCPKVTRVMKVLYGRGVVDTEHVSGVEATAGFGVECDVFADLQPGTVDYSKQFQPLP